MEKVTSSQISPNQSSVKKSVTSQKPQVHYIYYVALAVTILIFGVVVYQLDVLSIPKSKNPLSINTNIPPTPTQAPRPIPSGKQTFSVSNGKKIGPQFQTGAIDPYDPTKGNQQTISVSISSTQPVATATLTMQTDTRSKEIPMQLTSGTTNKGIWAATWTVDDTYLYTYNAIIFATDGQETNAITITLR